MVLEPKGAKIGVRNEKRRNEKTSSEAPFMSQKFSLILHRKAFAPFEPGIFQLMRVGGKGEKQ